MSLNFDSKGNLVPNTNIKCSLQLFYETFVTDISSVKRHQLFKNFELYINELKEITGNVMLTIWIDGSFATKKSEPGDLDLIIFLDYELVKKIEHQLTDFKYPNSLSKFELDAYIVLVYPREHRNYPLYIGDRMYWMDLFDKHKRNRRGTKVPKGFVEISI